MTIIEASQITDALGALAIATCLEHTGDVATIRVGRTVPGPDGPIFDVAIGPGRWLGGGGAKFDTAELHVGWDDHGASIGWTATPESTVTDIVLAAARYADTYRRATITLIIDYPADVDHPHLWAWGELTGTLTQEGEPGDVEGTFRLREAPSPAFENYVRNTWFLRNPERHS